MQGISVRQCSSGSFFFFQAEDGIRDVAVTEVQTCALPISEGNIDASPATWNWTVEEADTTPPETTIASGPPATTTDSSATFTFSAEAGATYACSLDGAADEVCTSPKEYTGLAAGAHTVRIRATDAAGNVEPSPASYSWTIEAPADTAPPETTIDSGPLATTTSTSATFAFSSSEAGSTFECRLDSQAPADFGSCSSPKTYPTLALGSHTVEVRAIDKAMNADQSPASYTWTIAPDCGSARTVSASADAWIDQNSPSTNKGADSILKVQSKGPSLNFRALVRFALPAAPQGCVVDSATLRLYASSVATGRTLQALRVDADWTENVVTWANQPQTAGLAATAASGTGKGYREWAVGSQVQAMYSGANHGFLIRDEIEDGGGFEQQFFSRSISTSRPQLVIRFVPDAAAPQTTIDSQPPATTTNASATFAFSSSEVGSTFKCSLDGAAFAACSSPHRYSGLCEGSHTFEVRAIDQAGNADQTVASYSWTITLPVADTTPPQTTIDSQPPATTTNANAAFAFSSSEPGSTFKCSLDGAAFAACSS